MEENKQKIIDTVTAVYKMIVYKSGKVEMIQQPIEYIFDDLNVDVCIFKPSSRISQIILVIEKVTDEIIKNKILNNLDNVFLNKLISKACNDVASENNVKVQSVFDKITRQLELNKEEFTKMLLDFYMDILKGDVSQSQLKIKLLQRASKNKENDDNGFINHSITQIENKLNNIEK